MGQQFKLTSQCQLSLAKKDFNRISKGFVFPKNSPLKPIMDKKLIKLIIIVYRFPILNFLFYNRILRLVQAGLIDYWRERSSSNVDKQCDSTISQKNNPRSLGLNDMQSPFLIWGIGTIVSLVVFLLECFIKLKHQ